MIETWNGLANWKVSRKNYIFFLFLLDTDIRYLDTDAKKIQKEEQHKIDNAEELTEDEQKEKEVLLYQGNFTSFILLFFNNFV